MTPLVAWILNLVTWTALLWAIVWGILWFYRTKVNKKRTLDLCFLMITMPKKESDQDEKNETAKDFKEKISIMEQLLTSAKSIASSSLSSKLLGQDLISLEYVADKNEIYFYVVLPKQYKALIEKQINWFYPDAIIEETLEKNIFEGKKYSVWTELYLAKDYFYPIKTYQKLESDPINNITNSISKLEEDESAVIQILLKPIDDDWQTKTSGISSEIMKGTKVKKFFNPFKFLWKILSIAFTLFSGWEDKDDGKKDDEMTTSALTQERAKTVDEKADKTGFEVIIRIITAWNNLSTIESELKNIAWWFAQFAYPDFNKFSASEFHNNDNLIKNYIYRYFKKPLVLFFKKSILNVEEIASLFHFPHTKYNKTPEIKWQNFKIVRAPTNIPKEWILLWTNVYRWVKRDVRLKTEDRFRHFYVIGQTGTWKSTVMLSMAKQDLANWTGIWILDPHGDLAKDLLPFIPRERADDLIYFDPTDTARPMWLNLLEIHDPSEMDLVAQDALNIMIKLFGNEIFGPRLQDYFRNGVLALMEYPGWAAITDLVRLFTDPTWQKERTRHVKNPIVKSWWENTYASMWDREKQEIIPYFSAKFGQFITNSTMRNIIGQTKSSFDIGQIMQDEKILLVNLSKWSLWDLNSQLLWMVLVSKLQMAAMRRDKIAKKDRKDFFLYIDEFQNYVTDAIESILSEARKYRLGLIVWHQYLWQLEKSDSLTKSSTNLKTAIFGNVWTKMMYKIWPEDAEFLAKEMAPNFSDRDLINMDKFKAAINLFVDNQPTGGFSIIPENPYLETWDEKIAKAMKELSRLKYGRDVAFVGKEIEYRIGVQ